MFADRFLSCHAKQKNTYTQKKHTHCIKHSIVAFLLKHNYNDMLAVIYTVVGIVEKSLRMVAKIETFCYNNVIMWYSLST